MSNAPTTEITQAYAKGRLSGTEIRGNVLRMWFQSPTGDESDSLIYDMPCRDMRQAVEVEKLHRERWDLEPVNRDHDLEANWLAGMKG